MFQKRKITAWMLSASLIGIFVCMSFFATSATLTYAAPHPPYHVNDVVKVLRGPNSGVGAVKVQNITQNIPGNCIVTSDKARITAVSIGNFDSQDHININTFSDAQCQNGTGQPYQNDLVRHLSNCGHLCREFVTT